MHLYLGAITKSSHLDRSLEQKGIIVSRNFTRLSFELIVDPFSFFHYDVSRCLAANRLLLTCHRCKASVSSCVVHVATIAISHAILPVTDIEVTVSNDATAEAVPLIINILALVNAVVAFSTETSASLRVR